MVDAPLSGQDVEATKTSSLSSNKDKVMDEKTGRRRLSGRGVWQQFTIQDGLPDMKIECLYEDSQGILWIGTHNRGVVRYDGREFETFTRRDGLSGDGVFSIVEDQAGTLWFGTNSGISSMLGEVFKPFTDTVSCNCLWGACTNDGALWFGLEKRPGATPAVCRIKGGQADVLSAKDGSSEAGSSIHRVVTDASGSVVCAGQGVFQPIGDDLCPILALDWVTHVKDMLPRADGSTFLSEYQGIFKYDLSTLHSCIRIADVRE